jgi:hypothetical protein
VPAHDTLLINLKTDPGEKNKSLLWKQIFGLGNDCGNEQKLYGFRHFTQKPNPKNTFR